MVLLALASALAAEPTWSQLRAPEASASSFLKSNWNKFTENYHPSYLLDGDPKTAWVEGVDGTGVGQWVEWAVSPVQGVRKIKIKLRNGYHKSDALLTANAAPKALTVELRLGAHVVHRAPWTVNRAMGWQELEIDPPTDVAFDAVRLVVDSAVEGRTYADLCVSDVEVHVDAASAFNGPVENAKHQALLAWIAERRADAAFFASQPKTWPFVATHFASAEVPRAASDIAAFEAEVVRLQTRADALLAQGVWKRADVKDRVRLPEGLPVPDELIPYFGGGLTLFEAQQEWRPKTASESPIGAWIKEQAVTNVKESAEGTTSTLAFRTRTVIEERGVTTTHARWLVELADGRPQRAFSVSTDDGGEGCESWGSAHIWSFTWTGDRVSGATQDGRYGCLKFDPADAEYFETVHERTVYRADASG